MCIRDSYATGWPVTSWLSKLRQDPLHRLHLDLGSRRKKELSRGTEPTDVQRSAMTARVGVAGAKVDTAVRALASEASEGLPRPWADSVRAASLSNRKVLPDDIDRAVASTIWECIGVPAGGRW